MVEQLEQRQMLSLTGAIWTTDSTCTVVNGNIYDSAGSDIQANKMTVFLNGGPKRIGAAGLNPNTDYYIRVTDPSGKTVLGSSYVVKPNGQGEVLANVTVRSDANGEIPCTRIWDVTWFYANGKLNQGFKDTPNPGGEYKAWVSLVNTFDRNESKTDNFKVRPPRGCHGIKFHDRNGNGVQDADEETLDGVTIFFDGSNGKAKNNKLDWSDLNANGIWDAGEGEQWTVTSTKGQWSLVPPSEGTFSVREVVPPGWFRTTPDHADVTILNGRKRECPPIGNCQPLDIHGAKFNDRNGDGVRQADELGINGVVIQLLDHNGNLLTSTTTMSMNGEDGLFWFNDILPNPNGLIVREVVPSGSVQTAPASGEHRITCRSGEDVTGLLFGNHTSILGRMTGGGSVFTNGTRVTHGFQIHTAQPPETVNNRLQINWAKKRFHLSKLTFVDGMDSASIVQGRNAPIDTIYGEGYGLYNGKTNANVQFTFVDAGEPGVNDTASITVFKDANNNGKYDSGETRYLSVSGALTYGNHAAHHEIASLSGTASNLQSQIDNTFAQLDNDNLSDDKVLSLLQKLLDLINQQDALLA